MTEESYSPREIRFNRSMMPWLMKNWVTFWEGSWPANPIGSGYVSIASITKGKSKAPFIGPCEVAAEIDVRLKKCWPDGILLKQYFCLGESVDYLAKFAHCSPEQVEGRIEKVLEYISGRWPKTFNDGSIKSYKEFKSHRKRYLREGK